MKIGDKSDESQLEISDESIFQIETQKGGPVGKIELTDEVLKHAPSGNLFGLSQNVGMGWSPKDFLGPQFLILNSHGGIRAEDGSPVALGYHTGHWEIGLLVKKAAEELKNLGGIPFAAHVSDPCDGRSQGTTAMFDSLAYRNDASLVMRRLTRSLPTAEGTDPNEYCLLSCDEIMNGTTAAAATRSADADPADASADPAAGEDCFPGE